MRYVYILLLGLIIYYIISRFYEKYIENFDPSLVPVSSIIILAKAGQKIIDGNATLTNPDNLQIGTPNATGNLLVTGDTNTTGNVINNGILTVGSSTNSGHKLDVTGNANITGNTNIGGTLGIGGATTIGIANSPTSSNLTVNGNTTITGNTIIKGKTTFGDLWIYSMDNEPRLLFSGDTHIGSPNGWTFRSKDNPNASIDISRLNAVSIDASGNIKVNDLTINKDVNVNGSVSFHSTAKLCIAGSCW